MGDVIDGIMDSAGILYDTAYQDAVRAERERCWKACVDWLNTPIRMSEDLRKAIMEPADDDITGNG
jgi:hypothetical protein